MTAGSPRRRDPTPYAGLEVFRRSLALGFALLLIATAALAAPAAIEVESAWCAPPPKGVTTGACYLALRNLGATEDRLIGVEADAAARVELHVTKVTDGIGRMRPLSDGVVLPAESVIDFKENGYHLMLVELRRPLVEGATLRGTLRFERSEPQPVLFHIGRPRAP